MKKPNVLLITVDHWRGDLLGALGNDNILTPTLDQIARNGVVFTQAYTTEPTCIPARRSLMLGVSGKTHNDRIYNEHQRMPKDIPTLAQTFRDAGYQAYAVGKIHVYPQRDRIGFDDVILNEEGRRLTIEIDDYEVYLKEKGYAGLAYANGMAQNEYHVRPWHLPEETHPTNWTAREMCKMIKRRDKTKPAFWYCSFTGPHPPVTPPDSYLRLYMDKGVDEPVRSDWSKDPEKVPFALREYMGNPRNYPKPYSYEEKLARIGFYAQCTYIDHQIRLLIGTLNQEGITDDTIILFTSDHGDSLGDHGLWAKTVLLEGSAKVPMILSVNKGNKKLQKYNFKDQRIACLRDVMPTLLDLCDIEIPETVEGLSMVSDKYREYLYGEHCVGEEAVRMIRKGKYKLLWYPAGNRFQLFNIEDDPRETKNLYDSEEMIAVVEELKSHLKSELYGEDLEFLKDGELVGMPARPYRVEQNRGLSGQRTYR